MGLFDFLGGGTKQSSSQSTNVSTTVQVENILDFTAIGEGFGKLAAAFQDSGQLQAATDLVKTTVDARLRAAELQIEAGKLGAAQVAAKSEITFERVLFVVAAGVTIWAVMK